MNLAIQSVRDIRYNARKVKRHAPYWADVRDLEQEGWLALLQGRKYSFGAMIDYLRREYAYHRPDSLNMTMADADGHVVEFIDLLPDTGLSALSKAELSEYRCRLFAAMACLTYQQQEVIWFRYFLDDYQGAMAHLGVTFGRISQLHKQAIECLRAQIGLDHDAVFPMCFDCPHLFECLLPAFGYPGIATGRRSSSQRAVTEVRGLAERGVQGKCSPCNQSQ